MKKETEILSTKQQLQDKISKSWVRRNIIGPCLWHIWFIWETTEVAMTKRESRVRKGASFYAFILQHLLVIQSFNMLYVCTINLFFVLAQRG